MRTLVMCRSTTHHDIKITRISFNFDYVEMIRSIGVPIILRQVLFQSHFSSDFSYSDINAKKKKREKEIYQHIRNKDLHTKRSNNGVFKII